MNTDAESIKKRIEKDIELFYKNVGSVTSENKPILSVVEMSRLYAKDSKSYLDKGDLYTSFSCISYAHGLLDAVREITK